MARHSATLAGILGCWLACLCSTTGASSKFLMRSSLHKTSGAGRQWRTLNSQQGMPKGCNCQGKNTGKKCADAANNAAMMAFLMATTTTMMAPAQPPIPPPPPPVPLPGPPPPLPLGPAKPLPGLPGLPGITVDSLPTLGPPPLFKMTPFPTMPPPLTTPAPPTTPGPGTPPWVMTPMGLIAGTTPNPYMKFFVSRYTMAPPMPAPAPAPAPAFFAGAPYNPVWQPVALVQEQPRTAWSPLSFLYRSFSHGAQGQSAEQECNCPDPCAAASVDGAFSSILDQGTPYYR